MTKEEINKTKEIKIILIQSKKKTISIFAVFKVKISHSIKNLKSFNKNINPPQKKNCLNPINNKENK